MYRTYVDSQADIRINVMEALKANIIIMLVIYSEFILIKMILCSKTF